jgi:hypothetical protein
MIALLAWELERQEPFDGHDMKNVCRLNSGEPP